MVRKKEKQSEPKDSPYISRKELAKRWSCSYSSVDRIARRVGLTRLFLGEGKNGMVRYVFEEAIEYEKSCTVRCEPER